MGLANGMMHVVKAAQSFTNEIDVRQWPVGLARNSLFHS
jgi:hypothetical protein